MTSRHGLRGYQDFVTTVLKPYYYKAWQWGEGCQKLSKAAWRHLWTTLKQYFQLHTVYRLFWKTLPPKKKQCFFFDFQLTFNLLLQFILIQRNTKMKTYIMQKLQVWRECVLNKFRWKNEGVSPVKTLLENKKGILFCINV